MDGSNKKSKGEGEGDRVETWITTNLDQQPTNNYDHSVSVLNFSFYVM